MVCLYLQLENREIGISPTYAHFGFPKVELWIAARINPTEITVNFMSAACNVWLLSLLPKELSNDKWKNEFCTNTRFAWSYVWICVFNLFSTSVSNSIDIMASTS